jgi:hypothetical protein
MHTTTYKLWTDGVRQAILSNVHTKSTNTKTGDMAQLSILQEAVKPTEGIKTRQDGLICGDCPLKHGKGCYVNPVSYNGTWRAVQGADVSPFPTLNKGLRFGTYGDPSFIPLDKVDAWSSAVPNWTGYTHQWHKVAADYSRFFMASIDGISNRTREDAKALGYRTFRILSPTEDVGTGEVLCPNTTHGVQCTDCGLCAGTSRGGKDIAIKVHGPSNKMKLWRQ